MTDNVASTGKGDAAHSQRQARAEIAIDWNAVKGPVKPVNGVGQPPMIGAMNSWPMLHFLKEAGIPFSRLHDVGGFLGGGLFVDIPNLFPDFDADETDPASYRFAYTDSLLSALAEQDVEPFFRLGVTIENWVRWGLPPVRAVPPPDFAKWARICEHVIRHYTEGWANGHRIKIRHWEIWNEPEYHSDPARNPMWGAPFEEYIRFYGIVAPYLKAKFPHIKIGGYGGCGYYAAVGSDRMAASNSSPLMKHYVECSHKFLATVRDNGWPLDFFSFHSYSEPDEAARQIRFADEHLNEYGFTADKCKRVFDEWLPHPSLEALGTALQAALVAAELIDLQNGPCDIACLYDARCGASGYSPLFNPLTEKPHKAYWAFMAFNELRKAGTAVSAAIANDEQGLRIAAACGNGRHAVMLVNPTSTPAPIANLSSACGSATIATGGADLPSAPSCRITDETRTWEEMPLPEVLPPHSILVMS